MSRNIKEAQENQRPREVIASDDKVKITFGTFILEDGRGKVMLDAMKAYEHVRYDMCCVGKSAKQEV